MTDLIPPAPRQRAPQSHASLFQENQTTQDQAEQLRSPEPPPWQSKRTPIPEPSDLPAPPPDWPPEIEPGDDDVPGVNSPARSNATRLMCAGVYLNAPFRNNVIDVLIKQAYRTVAPSYEYDALTVLGHALAARRLKRKQFIVMLIGALVLLLLAGKGVIGLGAAIVGIVWLLWAVPFLRRVSTLDLLANTLSTGRAGHGHGFDGKHPADKALTPDLVKKITTQQQGTGEGNVVVYGGYIPFIGAGTPVRDWNFPTLLVGKPPKKPDQPAGPGSSGATAVGAADSGAAADKEPRREPIIPFTVDELTGYVQARLCADLRDDPDSRQSLPLTVERRHYVKALPALVKRRRWRESSVFTEAERATAERTIGAAGASSAEREHYHAAREYLSIRIKSWDGELVTSVFAGFDIRGTTLYCEFHSYVLSPVVEGFHLVDQMPEGFRPRLLLRVGWDLVGGIPHALFSRTAQAAKAALRTMWQWGKGTARPKRTGASTDMGLARYTLDLIDTGALVSLRELAASKEFHHFFQKADSTKYMKIMERQLMDAVRDFLREHDVDMGDYDAQQTNILNNYNGAVQYGNGTLVQGGSGHHVVNQQTAPAPAGG